MAELAHIDGDDDEEGADQDRDVAVAASATVIGPDDILLSANEDGVSSSSSTSEHGASSDDALLAVTDKEVREPHPAEKGLASETKASVVSPSAVAGKSAVHSSAMVIVPGSKLAAIMGKDVGAAPAAPHSMGTMTEAQKKKVTLVRRDVDTDRNLTGVETREAGAISWKVVSTYFGNGGGWATGISLLVLFGLEQAARVWTDKWVGLWFTNKYGRGNWFYLGIYAAMGLAYGLVTFVRSLTFLFMCVAAAVNTHNQLLDHVLSLPKSFFDTNPAGRVLNRFSRDTDIMDSALPASLIQFAGCLATYVSIMVVIATSTKWFAVALGPLTIIYILIQRYYIPTARELQRIESVSRSPIYSKFSEALAGVATIRAYRKENHFTLVSDR